MWKPIKTAPHDGTIVDLWHKDGFRLTDQWWAGEGDDWCGFYNSEFTHWMETPNPPKTLKFALKLRKLVLRMKRHTLKPEKRRGRHRRENDKT